MKNVFPFSEVSSPIVLANWYKAEKKISPVWGNTLYIDSLKSEVYFCVYEKDYEQYVKYDIPVEETLIKNRFEIRLKNERAYYAVRDLLTYHDAERTAFSIINVMSVLQTKTKQSGEVTGRQMSVGRGSLVRIVGV